MKEISDWLKKHQAKQIREADRLASRFWFDTVSEFIQGTEPLPIGIEEENSIANACFKALMDHTIGFHQKQIRGENPRPFGIIRLSKEAED